jgi:riboflavin synthase
MFTGIITDVGEVVERTDGHFMIRTDYPAASIAIGASIGCDGCCLTVTSVAAEAHGGRFTVDASNETRAKTTIGQWQPGRRVNLERSLALGAELGGHVVTGHVDGVARILDITPDGESWRVALGAPEHLARYIAPKGSIALDGASLTVNEVMGPRFGVNLIPHTLTVTTWRSKKPGDTVNLEVDVFARYVARLMEFRP